VVPLRAIALFSLIPAISQEASAEPSPYCRKVQEKASADAALLMFPEVVAQAFRSPSIIVDPFITATALYQVRVGLSFSPVDFLKGNSLYAAAEADCERDLAQRNIEEMLAQVEDIGKADALRQQLEFLNAHRPDWEQLRKKAADRLAIQQITFVEYRELEDRVLVLERHVTEQLGELGRIEARGYVGLKAGVSQLTSQYERANLTYERRAESFRALLPWQLQLSAGVVPWQYPTPPAATFGNSIGWYALVDFKFSLGAFSPASAKYVEAREDEVREAPYELVAQSELFRRETQARKVQAQRQLDDTKLQLSATTKARELLEHAGTAAGLQIAGLMQIEEIWFQSDEIYLRTLIDQLDGILNEVNPTSNGKRS
jgi:hypothetical protein